MSFVLLFVYARDDWVSDEGGTSCCVSVVDMKKHACDLSLATRLGLRIQRFMVPLLVSCDVRSDRLHVSYQDQLTALLSQVRCVT
jgi:hypothetical protein